MKMNDLVGVNFQKNGIELNQHYHYAILDASHIDQVVELFTNAFCDSEPMTHYLRMDKIKYREFARQVTEKAVADQLSVVALDKDKVIACALVEDLAAPGDITADFDPKFENILCLLEKLGTEFFQEKTFPKNHIAHLFITAVDHQYRHQGLSRQINFLAMDLAEKKGFDFIYCEFTHVFNELGTIAHLSNHKKLIGSCTYNKFTHKNEKPFATLSGSANSYLWEIRPNAKLNYSIDDKKFSLGL